MNARRRAFATLALAVFLAPVPASAQGGNSCAISVTGVDFGTYDVFSVTPVRSTGGVTFRCGGRVPTNPVRIGLSPGRSSTFYPRVLSRAGESLAYNLYRDAAGTQIWGDGTNGTFDVPMTFQANQWIPLTIYAEIPPSQDVTAGAYTDAITATINF
jgi:spore coat protein U-like protein